MRRLLALVLLIFLLLPILAQETPTQEPTLTPFAPLETLTPDPSLTPFLPTETLTPEPTLTPIAPTVTTPPEPTALVIDGDMLSPEITSEVTSTLDPSISLTTPSEVNLTSTLVNTLEESLTPLPIQLVFQELFETLDSSLWDIGTGWMLGTKLVQVDQAYSLLSLRNMLFPNVILEVGFQSLNANFVVVLQENIEGRYEIVVDSSGQVRLYRNGVILGEARLESFTPEALNILRVELFNGNITLTVNNQALIAVQDFTPLPAGRLSFYSIFDSQTAGLLRLNNIFLYQRVDSLNLESEVADPFPTLTPSPSLTPSLMPTLTPSATLEPTVALTETPFVDINSLNARLEAQSFVQSPSTLPTVVVTVSSATTLRDVLLTANPPTGCTHHTIINLSAASYIVPTPPPGTGTAYNQGYGQNGYPIIRCPVTINGLTTGTGSTFIRPTAVNTQTPVPAYRFFEAAGTPASGQTVNNPNGAVLNLNRLTFINGLANLTGGGAVLGVWSTITLNRVIMDGNRVITTRTNQEFGGGIYSYLGPLQIYYSIFRNNSVYNGAHADGGGIGYLGDSLTILNSSITNNSARRYGAGIYVQNSARNARMISSCIQNNLGTPGFDDVAAFPGSPSLTNSTPVMDARYNFWNVATGPNSGGEQSNLAVLAFPFLAAVPVPGCGTPVPTPVISSMALVHPTTGAVVAVLTPNGNTNAIVIPTGVSGLRLQLNTTPASFGYTRTPAPTATGPTPFTRTPTPTVSGNGSVQFQVNGTPSLDSSAPYQVADLLGPGIYTIFAEPYMDANQGVAIATRPASFRIASPTFTPTPTLTPRVAAFAFGNGSITPTIYLTVLPVTGTPTPVQINPAQYNATGVFMYVYTTPGNLVPGGVIMRVNGTPYVDNTTPYRLPPTLGPGSYVIAATPYGRPTAVNVTPGSSGQIAVQIITPTQTPTPAVSSLLFTDLNQNPITPNPTGNAFNLRVLQQTSTPGIIVNAVTTPMPLGATVTPGGISTPTPGGNGSVRFIIRGTASTDNSAPYQATIRATGTYAITAIPYNQPNMAGTRGAPTSVVIQVNYGTFTPTPTLTPTPSPTLTPSATATPTVLFCPSGFSAFTTSESCITLTPTSEPTSSCVFDATTLIYYRAPITNNPRNGTLQYGSFYNYVADQKFVDHVSQTWYRIIRIELDSQPGVNQDPVIASNGAVWVPSFGSPIGGFGCSGGSGLPIATEYTIPTHPWNSFSALFGGWPVDVQEVCDSATTPREIHTLGIGNPSFYPRGTHTGADLFVPNASTNVQVRSLGEGIIVGMGRGTSADNPFTHAYWGASTLFVGGQQTEAWSVIIRHGHLFVVYGHLDSLNSNIWVGKGVQTGTLLGIQGMFNDRHSHIEIHSFGASIADGIGITNAAEIGSIGILPVNKTAEQFVAPFLYDVMQLLPNPPGYLTSANGGLDLRNLVETGQLILMSSEGQLSLNLVGSSGCNFMYRTIHPVPSAIIDESSGYRGFVAYSDYSRTLPSPLNQTQQP